MSFAYQLVVVSLLASAHHWPAATAPVIPAADGYVPIANGSVMPQKTRIYRAVFDATRAADRPSELVPALNMAGSELNLFGATGVPLRNVKFVVVFHGPALDGVLDDAHYRAKFGTANPNLTVLAQMRRAGVELYVCGQNVAALDLDPRTLSPDVKIASDALVVLMQYQGMG